MNGRGAVDLSGVAVVIPCYRAAGSIADVIREIPDAVASIICVDDASDDATLTVLEELSGTDPRIRVLRHETNQGVGGATVSGYRAAITGGADVIVKMDSDGQMDPSLIPSLVGPILRGEADYVKGNRFFDIEHVRAMPKLRILGNAGLSFISKLSTGYWDLFDPTNGFTVIQADVAALVPLAKLHKRYFFESDLLFRLRCLGARVVEQPMVARYGNETSHLSEFRAALTFPFLHARNLLKRIVYNYFLRGFDVGSLSLLAGLALTGFGVVFGIAEWTESIRSQVPATAGTVMLSAFPLLVGIQLLLAFLQRDLALTPKEAIHSRLAALTVLGVDDPVVEARSGGAGDLSRD
jgi:dolichol-phosphate mannosyltransferase